MKPNWTDAPEWANYWAVDENGEMYWYRVKPITHQQNRYWMPENDRWGDGAVEPATLLDWEETLQKRPEKES